MTDVPINDGEITTSILASGILGIKIDRQHKRNSFTPKMLRELAEAYTLAENNELIRVVILYAAGDHFTGGLDLNIMADYQKRGELLFPFDDLVDPCGLGELRISKPVLVATEGVCYTVGVELILASDIAVAGKSSRFSQIEVQRAICAYGGATIRMVERAGWGNAMSLLLTGDEFTVDIAKEFGFIQSITSDGEALAEALSIAKRIAAAAPLAVQATLRSARTAIQNGPKAAVSQLPEIVKRMAATEDALEGVSAFKEKRDPVYQGK